MGTPSEVPFSMPLFHLPAEALWRSVMTAPVIPAAPPLVAGATKGGRHHRSQKALIPTQKILQRETAGFDDWQG